MNRSSHIAVKRNHHDSAAGSTAAAAGRTPADDDFEAIEQAVMATPRGRWFLSEYLRRRQNDETRRLVQALRKLAHAGSEDVARYRAVLEQERAALDGIRLLLARTADTLCGNPCASEPTLPEAAASRLAEVLETAAGNDAATTLRQLIDMLRELARLLGEPAAETVPAPDSSVRIVTAAAEQAGAPCAPAANAATAGSARTSATARKARIVIRKHGHSQEVDIPLPDRTTSQPRAEHSETGVKRRHTVRIHRHKGSTAERKEKDESVATLPHSTTKVEPDTPHPLADETVKEE